MLLRLEGRQDWYGRMELYDNEKPGCMTGLFSTNTMSLLTNNPTIILQGTIVCYHYFARVVLDTQ
jgi:hypothetical protein